MRTLRHWVVLTAVLTASTASATASSSWAAVKQPSKETRATPSGIGDEPYRRPDQRANVKQASGEITAVDLALGRLTLREIADSRPGETNDYVINERDTSVSDPLDKQFLKLEDLQPGYLVRVDYAPVDGRRLAQKVTVDSVNNLRWAVGEVTSVDPGRRSVEITQLHPSAAAPPIRTGYEVNSQTQVMDLAERRFITLADLQPGETVQIEYTLNDGRRVARLISSLEPVPSMAPAVSWSAGQIEAVDLDSGLLVVSERIPNWNYEERVNYVVDLADTRVVDLRGRRFLTMNDLKAGQPVRLQFVETPGGQRSVQTVVLRA